MATNLLNEAKLLIDVQEQKDTKKGSNSSGNAIQQDKKKSQQQKQKSRSQSAKQSPSSKSESGGEGKKQKDKKEKDKEQEKEKEKDSQQDKDRDNDKDQEKDKDQDQDRVQKSRSHHQKRRESSQEERQRRRRFKSRSKSSSDSQSSSRSNSKNQKKEKKKRISTNRKQDSSKSRSRSNRKKNRPQNQKKRSYSSSSRSSKSQQKDSKPYMSGNMFNSHNDQQSILMNQGFGLEQKSFNQNLQQSEQLKTMTLEDLNKYSNLGIRAGSPIPHNQQIQPIYKYARRLYVGNIPHLIAPEFLTEWLYRSLEQAEGLLESGNPIIETKIEANCQYAFIELRSLEETSAMLQLDGIMLWSKNLRIKRPTEYEKNQQVIGTRPVPELNLTKLQKLGIFVIKSQVEDTANKLFLANLANTLEDGQIIQALDLRRFGQLKSFHLVKEGGSKESKGYAFLQYSTEEQTEHAIRELNGLNFHGRTLVCKKSGSQQDAQSDLGLPSNPGLNSSAEAVKYSKQFFELLDQKMRNSQM